MRFRVESLESIGAWLPSCATGQVQVRLSDQAHASTRKHPGTYASMSVLRQITNL